MIFLIIFIITLGVMALLDTEFTLGNAADNLDTDWSGDIRTLVMFNANFSPLAGILCTGYFLHSCSLAILRSSKNPEKRTRDLFLGYLLVMMSYVVCGVLGYIGFIGVRFSAYYLGAPQAAGQINQVCLNMFNYTSIPAFILRFCIFMLLFSTYPLVHFFLNTMVLILFFKNKTLTRTQEILLNVAITTVPLLFALFYTNVGTILGYVGALSGFLIIYVLPVLVYLKQMKTQINNPILAEALKRNQFTGQQNTLELSPKISVNDELIKKRQDLRGALLEKDTASAMRRYYIQCVLHSFIPLFGFLIVLFQFYHIQ